MQVLIAGCGWLGGALAQQLLARGDRVIGVRSSPDAAEHLRALGVEPLVLDLAAPGAAERLPRVDAILALQSARGREAASYRRAYLDVNRTLLAASTRPEVRAFVYTGSTGLFGQRDGSDVDEGTPPAPATAEGEVLAEAEQAILAAAARGLPARILRLSGLYGPGRLWLLDGVARGSLALGPGDEAWMNACHQEDAVLALLAVLDRGRNGAIYHATDATPMRRREVITLVAERLGLTAATASQASGAAPNRRILGAGTRRELDLQLRWPSLREGLEPFLQPLPPSPLR